MFDSTEWLIRLCVGPCCPCCGHASLSDVFVLMRTAAILCHNILSIAVAAMTMAQRAHRIVLHFLRLLFRLELHVFGKLSINVSPAWCVRYEFETRSREANMRLVHRTSLRNQGTRASPKATPSLPNHAPNSKLLVRACFFVSYNMPSSNVLYMLCGESKSSQQLFNFLRRVLVIVCITSKEEVEFCRRSRHIHRMHAFYVRANAAGSTQTRCLRECRRRRRRRRR